ncbi:hypothetical protein VNO77_30459 [Canavalia gladiata]|uniref:Uncharacterized protein n=1 Tax=Canavalia gladiata TaxID=3824 RepID=A0AAN9KN17_CANGL
MKHVTLDSNVFLLGGECIESGAIPTKGYVSNHPNSYLGSSNRVLKLSFEKNAFHLKHTSLMKRFLYGKCSPMIEKIKGKIYVLEDMPYLQQHHLNCPFEVYDPDKEYSRPLNNPPPYARYPQGKIEGHVVLGDKFVVFEKISNEEIDGYFYDTTHMNCGWERLDPNVVFFFVQGCLLPLPINGMCVPFFPTLKHLGIELVLSRKGIEEGYAMLINASSSMLLFYQPLIEFYGHFPLTETGERAHLNNGRNFFFLLPDNQICAIWIAFDHHKMLRLFVTIFSLELCFDPTTMPSNHSSPSQPVEKKFLKVSNIHTWDCMVRKDGASSNHIFDVFFYPK